MRCAKNAIEVCLLGCAAAAMGQDQTPGNQAPKKVERDINETSYVTKVEEEPGKKGNYRITLNDGRQLSIKESPETQKLQRLIQSKDYSPKATKPGKCATVHITFFAGKGKYEISTGYRMAGDRLSAYHTWDVQVLGVNHKKHYSDHGIGEGKGWVETYKSKAGKGSYSATIMASNSWIIQHNGKTCEGKELQLQDGGKVW